MTRPQRCFNALALLLATAAALAQEPAGEGLAQARERIASEREVLLAGFEAEDQACRRRFFVNSCLRDLAVRRREALAPLREQEIRIEEAQRQRLHDEALARRAHKEAERAAAQPEGARQESASRESAGRALSQAEREAQARQRAQQQTEREREAARRQREREEAARARARRGDAPGLPVPGQAR